MGSPADRRAAPRYALPGFVAFCAQCPSGRQGWPGLKRYARLLDISHTGMQVLTTEPQIRGGRLQCEIKGPDAKDVVAFTGEVMWSRESAVASDYYSVGLRVVSMPPGHQERLHLILERRAVAVGLAPGEAPYNPWAAAQQQKATGAAGEKGSGETKTYALRG